MSLAPKLEKRSVSTDKLLLDPNNPRLFTTEIERVPLADVPNPGVQRDTRAKLRTEKDKFRIDELIESIKTNGYVPEAGGYIFVRALAGTEYFLVLEGNRRLISISELISQKSELDPEILLRADIIVTDSISQSLVRGEIFKGISAGVISKNDVIEAETTIQ